MSPPIPASECLAAVNARVVCPATAPSVCVEFGLFEDFEADFAADCRCQLNQFVDGERWESGTYRKPLPVVVVAVVEVQMWARVSRIGFNNTLAPLGVVCMKTHSPCLRKTPSPVKANLTSS
jgi:hypothetical protein